MSNMREVLLEKVRELMIPKKIPATNGTYLTCLACPFFLTSALADRRDLVSKG